MTNKQKLRLNSFDAEFNDRQDDFILADLNLMLDEEEYSPVPLKHFLDDDAVIDRLLINSDFDQFIVEPIEPAKQNGHTETEEISVSDNYFMADFDPIQDSVLMLDKDATDVVSKIEENPETAIDKKQINDSENKVKKAAIITYISLSFGIVALLSTVVMGIIVSSVQTKVSKLTELVSILEEDMSNIAEKNSDLDINNGNSSVEQLNHKANGFTDQFEEKTQSSSDISENVKTADVTKQAAVNKSNDKQKTKTSVLENKKLSEAAIKKISAEKKGNNTQPAAGWSVNLQAYGDLSYAKSKAKNFIQKGIPVKVIAVDMNNTKWYRLKVVGFKNEKEATAYAAKIKKSHNLNTVFVGKN